ncbi:MAG: HAD-IA family hydrolase [Propionibacteriaceae bacterium]|nr:HAD-IA family hydrolase [Propionibacteriaceae bacterium]
MTPRWPVVLFDLDGTLVNTIDLIVASYQHSFRTVLGHEWDVDEIKSWIGQSLVGSLKNAVPDRADELFDAYVEWNHAHTPDMLSDYPGVHDLLSDLLAAGVRLGCVTSKRYAGAQWALDLAHLAELVPLVISHDDVSNHKPHPEPLTAGAAKMNCAIDDTVYIGDALVDIQAARAAGMECIAVTWGAGDREALIAANPTWVVDTAEELRSVLLPQ